MWKINRRWIKIFASATPEWDFRLGWCIVCGLTRIDSLSLGGFLQIPRMHYGKLIDGSRDDSASISRCLCIRKCLLTSNCRAGVTLITNDLNFPFSNPPAPRALIAIYGIFFLWIPQVSAECQSKNDYLMCWGLFRQCVVQKKKERKFLKAFSSEFLKAFIQKLS